MATVRKRKLPSGLIRWQASYIDGGGNRRAKLFNRKSDGDAWLIETRHDVARGLHTADSMSPTVKVAAALWLRRCVEKKLETSTLRQYEEHIDLHIVPFIGARKLSDLTVPAVNAYADQLREAGRSDAMIKRAIKSLRGCFQGSAAAWHVHCRADYRPRSGFARSRRSAAGYSDESRAAKNHCRRGGPLASFVADRNLLWIAWE